MRIFRAAAFIGCLVMACGMIRAQQPNAAPQKVGPGNSAAARQPEQEIVYLGHEKARLGVTLSEDNKGRVWIQSVSEGSPADWAHLRPGDQIVAMNETTIRSYADAVRFINRKKPDDEITVAIKRDGVPGGGVTVVLGPARGPQSNTPDITPGNSPNTGDEPAQARQPEQEIAYLGHEKARLGVTLSEDGKGRVWVQSVLEGSPADWAHLRAGDQIVAMNETTIRSYADAVRFINRKKPDDEITVAIQRDGVPGGGVTVVLGGAQGANSTR
jgi:S1-C subfamily serine protease